MVASAAVVACILCVAVAAAAGAAAFCAAAALWRPVRRCSAPHPVVKTLVLLR